MILYDASYIWWLIYSAVPFFVLLLLTNSMAGSDVKFKDIGPEHGDGPYYMKFLTYFAAMPMCCVLVLMIGSGYWNAFSSI
jgi:hypothetical protein